MTLVVAVNDKQKIFNIFLDKPLRWMMTFFFFLISSFSTCLTFDVSCAFYLSSNFYAFADHAQEKSAGKKIYHIIVTKTSKFVWMLNDIRIEKIISDPI